MAALKANAEMRQFRHDLRQPVNVLRLTAANLRSRLAPGLDEEASAYLLAKLDRIEKQADRLSLLIDSLPDCSE
jgi:signal transduction histidine kinase